MNKLLNSYVRDVPDVPDKIYVPKVRCSNCNCEITNMYRHRKTCNNVQNVLS